MAHCLAPDIVSVSAQTLLFSATMPSALHEFAKAGLKDPEMVRLDTDTRISPELSTAFFTVRCGPHNSSTLCQGCAALPVSYQEAVCGKESYGKEGTTNNRKLACLDVAFLTGCCLLVLSSGRWQEGAACMLHWQIADMLTW